MHNFNRVFYFNICTHIYNNVTIIWLINQITVSFITKQHVFTVNFSSISTLRETVRFFSWYLGGKSVVESHQRATIVVITVQGFPLSPGRESGYIHVGLSLCDVIAASFFLFHLFLSYPWFTTTGPLALLLSNKAQVFTLAAPSFPPSFSSYLSLVSSAICLPDCLEFNWNIVHTGR